MRARVRVRVRVRGFSSTTGKYSSSLFESPKRLEISSHNNPGNNPCIRLNDGPHNFPIILDAINCTYLIVLSAALIVLNESVQVNQILFYHGTSGQLLQQIAVKISLFV